MRQTKETGELEGKYDAIVFILVACRLPIAMVIMVIGCHGNVTDWAVF